MTAKIMTDRTRQPRRVHRHQFPKRIPNRRSETECSPSCEERRSKRNADDVAAFLRRKRRD